MEFFFFNKFNFKNYVFIKKKDEYSMALNIISLFDFELKRNFKLRL